MKTVDEVLNQKYMSAKDLMIVIPELTYNRALQYIKDAIVEMKDKNYFVPECRTKVALSKIIKKRFGL